jgi:hypothetical protein|tara:strand:+ start:647 stop:826 length:180 start_codon:yes stop_codon:yes gene_type:complete
MNIKSAKYILNETKDGNGTVITGTVDGTEMSIPTDPDNRHYAEILKQQKAGTLTIEDAD